MLAYVFIGSQLDYMWGFMTDMMYVFSTYAF